MGEVTVAKALVETFKKEEVPFVAGVPGGGTMEIMDCMYNDPNSRYILVRHEQSASLMAHGYGRVTGKPAVCIASRCGGAANMSMGVWGSHVESTPMVAITTHVSSKFLNRGAFEEGDIREFMKPITKWSEQAPRSDKVIEYTNEAFRVCQTGRPGPAHLTIPLDFPAHKIDESFINQRGSTRTDCTIYPDPDKIAQAANLLLEASKPAMIVGGGLISAQASGEAMSLAKLLTMPIAHTWQRKPVDEREDLSVGSIGVVGSKPSAMVLKEADVVLVVGCRFSEMSTEQYRLNFPETTKIIHIDVDPNVIGKIIPVSLGIVSDARVALRSLALYISSQLKGEVKNIERLADIRAWKNAWSEELNSTFFDGEPIIIPKVIKDLRQFLGEDDALVLDSGNFIHDTSLYFQSYQPNNYIYGTGGLMGFGLPGALGVKLALPESKVVCLAGDGGFSMTVQEIETALRENIPVVCVVLNNYCLGNIKVRQKLKLQQRYIGVDFAKPQDFAMIARGFGAFAETVTKPQDIKPALNRAFKSKKVAVLDVIIDPDDISERQSGGNWW